MKTRVFIDRESRLAFILILLSIFFIFSCRGSDTESKLTEGTAVIKVNLNGEAFGDESSLKQATLGNKVTTPLETIQRKITPFNKDFDLVAELLPVSTSSSVNNEQASLKGAPMAITETILLGSKIKYKVVVYKSTGEYVTERDYIHGQESSTAILNLDGGSNYTFIAYSINSTTTLPSVTFSDLTNKTLSTSILSEVNGSSDFMYYRTDMQVSGNNPNYLNIVLVHKLSQITATIDASATGYNITAVNAGFDSHYPTYDVDIKTGTVSRKGAVGIAPVVFSTLGTPVIVGQPTIVNGSTLTGNLILSSITIGPLVQSIASNALTDLKIISGVKYNLKLSIQPTDIYLTYNGQSAARINGKIWMRYNLGADMNSNPDQNPSVVGLHGNYYTFGRRLPIAGKTDTSPNNDFNSSPASDNAWNTGTESNPAKTTNDPCPTGYRVPTQTEFQALIDATLQNSVGTWSASNTNYTAATVLTSKKNRNVKIVLPAQGSFGVHTSTSIWGVKTYTSNGLANDRGLRGIYWTSTINNNISYFRALADGALIRTVSAGNGDVKFPEIKLFGHSIRCTSQ
ncbi:FISUMP domain-containing protein [Elizabethkingia ursingii]|uniref:FISUMP domain-containing protein n=1 Tax=Elizabethkingia ursingii TaxID=1756150 RepID=UPI00099A2E67|nr:FISUMP domain-containing protein [Elizabethkingia ursingii]